MWTLSPHGVTLGLLYSSPLSSKSGSIFLYIELLPYCSEFRKDFDSRDRAGGNSRNGDRWRQRNDRQQDLPQLSLVADRFPRGEVVGEQWHIDNKFIQWRGKDLKYLNRRFLATGCVSRPRDERYPSNS